jgi:hypothetical protein
LAAFEDATNLGEVKGDVFLGNQILVKADQRGEKKALGRGGVGFEGGYIPAKPVSARVGGLYLSANIRGAIPLSSESKYPMCLRQHTRRRTRS